MITVKRGESGAFERFEALTDTRGESYPSIRYAPPRTPIFTPPPERTLTRAERRRAARSRERNWRWAPGRRRALRVPPRAFIFEPLPEPIELRGRLYVRGYDEVLIYLRAGDEPTPADLRQIDRLL